MVFLFLLLLHTPITLAGSLYYRHRKYYLGKGGGVEGGLGK